MREIIWAVVSTLENDGLDMVSAEPKSQHGAALAVALEELPKCQRVASTWETIGTAAKDKPAPLLWSGCKVTLAGLLLGGSHISLCKVCYSNMFSQVSAARPLAT